MNNEQSTMSNEAGTKMSDKLIVNISPHIYTPRNTQSIMRDVVFALVPALVASGYFFGMRAILVVLVCVVTCIISEIACRMIMKRPVTVSDGSAALTGILLAFCLPPAIPFWTAAIGSCISIVIGKELFGGLGHNPFNPALVGRAALLASWPVHMTVWSKPLRMLAGSVDVITAATPLARLKEGIYSAGSLDLFLGQVAGSLGETSVLALMIGGLYLLGRKVIGWRIPFSYIATVAVFAGLAGQNITYHICAGGLMLGAFFMATDYVTSPITPRGKIVFGIGCGLLTMLIRLYGGFPEGVCYAILLMNALTPLIERYTQPRMYGV